MGIAASQARYLALTARKSNVEFQGQMVNQARTNLANESANIYNEMMNTKAPTVPSVYDYINTKAAFKTSGSEQVYYVNSYEKIEGNLYEANGEGTYKVKFQYSTDENKTFQYFDGTAILEFASAEGKIPTSVGNVASTSEDPQAKALVNALGGATAVATTYTQNVYDQAAYEEANQLHEYEIAVYNQKIQELHLRTEKLQMEDRTLELQLRQLDTEQDALQTELDSVKKVIEKNVETVFKTFQD